MYGKRVFYFSFHKQIVHRGLTTNYATILAILHSVGVTNVLASDLVVLVTLRKRDMRLRNFSL